MCTANPPDAREDEAPVKWQTVAERLEGYQATRSYAGRRQEMKLISYQRVHSKQYLQRYARGRAY